MHEISLRDSHPNTHLLLF